MTVPLPLVPLATPAPAPLPVPPAPGADFLAILMAAEQTTETEPPQTHAEGPEGGVPEPAPKPATKPKKTSAPEGLPLDWTVPQPTAPQPPDRPPLTALGLPVAAEPNTKGSDPDGLPLDWTAPRAAVPQAPAVETLDAEGRAEFGVAVPDGVPTAAPKDAMAAAASPWTPPAPPAGNAAIPSTPAKQALGRRAETQPAPRRGESPRGPERVEAPKSARPADGPAPVAPAPDRNPGFVEAFVQSAVHELAPTPAPSSEPLPTRPESVSRREAAPSAKSHLAFGARLVEKPAEAVEAVPPGGRGHEAARRAPDQQAAEAEAPRRAAHAAAAPEILPDETSEPQPAAFAPIRESSAERAERSEAPEKAAPAKPAGRAEASAEPPRTSAVARDIRLEVGGGERKVEVRVIERAGEVQLAVRTPDNRLAGALRENLPLLSSRLEQSGWHADGWHAAEAGGPARRLEMPSSAPSSGDSPQQQAGGGREQRDPEPRPQRQERNEPKEKGNRFEWLMESLR